MIESNLAPRQNRRTMEAKQSGLVTPADSENESKTSDVVDDSVTSTSISDSNTKEATLTTANTPNNRLKPRNATHYNSWHYTDMIQAIKAVQCKALSMTAAAKKYGIPRTTLRHYLNDGTNKEAKRLGFFLSKEQENLLVECVLKHHTLSEKQLYKYIFEKAKELCAFPDMEGDCRKMVPTPAWIRRFVYRQKRLHALFPTFLNKLENPLHGGHKLSNEVEEQESHDHLMEISGRRSSTEIIFPNRRTPDLYEIHANYHTNPFHRISGKIDEECESSEPSPTQNTVFSTPQTILKKYHCSSEESEINDISTTKHLQDIEASKRRYIDVDNDVKDHFSYREKDEYIPFFSSKQRRQPYVQNDLLSMLPEKKLHGDQGLRKRFSSPCGDETFTSFTEGNYFELQVMKEMLHSIEQQLGPDYVSLFNERFSRNQVLERCYCKWVSLKTDVAWMQASSEK